MDRAQAALDRAVAEAVTAGAAPEGIGAAANLTLPELNLRVLMARRIAPVLPASG